MGQGRKTRCLSSGLAGFAMLVAACSDPDATLDENRYAAQPLANAVLDSEASRPAPARAAEPRSTSTTASGSPSPKTSASVDELRALVRLHSKARLPNVGEADPNSEEQRLRSLVPLAPDPEELRELAETLAEGELEEFRQRVTVNLFVVRGMEIPPSDEGQITVAAHEDTLTANTLELLSFVGGSAEEARLKAGVLRAFGGARGEVAGSRAVAQKVRVGRHILGVPVSGDYLIATFTMGGRLMKVLGKWRAIDYAASQFVTEYSEEELLEAAVQGLASSGLVLRPTVHAIEVGLQYYYPNEVSESGSHVVAARGYALLRDSNGNGQGSEGTIPAKYFSLDPAQPLALPGPDPEDLAESSSDGGSQEEEPSEDQQ